MYTSISPLVLAYTGVLVLVPVYVSALTYTCINTIILYTRKVQLPVPVSGLVLVGAAGGG
jgi:hypothetical protein